MGHIAENGGGLVGGCNSDIQTDTVGSNTRCCIV